jgi:hypothetical protein
MDLLNDIQLELERLKLQLGHFPDSFYNVETIKLSLDKMEDYLNDGITEYEQHAFQLSRGPEDVLFERMTWLIDFTGHFRSSRFAHFAFSYAEALAAIREELLPLKSVLRSKSSSSKAD